MTRNDFIQGLYLARFVASAAILCVVIAGALGYGDEVKIIVASIGSAAAIALKASQIIV